MKLRNVRRRQWERCITRTAQMPGADHIVITAGYDRQRDRQLRQRHAALRHREARAAHRTRVHLASGMAGILAFDQPPIRLWQAHGLNCAIYWGFISFNGYVQLPADNIDRVLAEVTVRVSDEAGYGAIGGIDVEWGLTYGPDHQGWIGFDTGHFNDVWDNDEIERHLRAADTDSWARHVFDGSYMTSLGVPWPPGRAFPGRRLWTMDRLVAVTEQLAADLANPNRRTDDGPDVAALVGSAEG